MKFIDSSDDESEEKLTKIISKQNYASYIIDILKVNDITNAEEFKVKLGLLLHNLADRFFRNTIINNIYQEIKLQMLGNTSQQLLINIKDAFNQKLSELFELPTENPLTDSQYVQLFNSLFNKSITIPEVKLKENISVDIVRQELLQTLINTEVNLKQLYVNPMTLTLPDTATAAGLLAFSKVVNRNNKNKIKYLTQQQTDNYSSASIYNIPKSELGVFTDSHVIHYGTGNVQTEIFGLGDYKNILSKIPQSTQLRQAFVARIFATVQNKDHSMSTSEPEGIQKFNNFAEQLAHLLFIVEMQRNNTAVFIAPMFLELIVKDKKYISSECFPMAMKDAVPYARGVSVYCREGLPNAHIMDYDKTNVKPATKLLVEEGNIFIKWVSEVNNDNRFSDIVQVLDIITATKAICSKQEDRVSVKDIIEFIKGMKYVKYPANLSKLEELLQSLSTELILKFGERYEPNLKLAKSKLLEKFTTEEDKIIIINIYTAFKQATTNIPEFLPTAQEQLVENIRVAVSSILKTLSIKIKDWYTIMVPKYIFDESNQENAITKRDREADDEVPMEAKRLRIEEELLTTVDEGNESQDNILGASSNLGMDI